MKPRKPLAILLTLLLVSTASAQRGDRTDTAEHVQRPPWFPIPPSPALSPEEALQTIRVAPGFRVELVASEPHVVDPVAIAFDADGNIWAVEMRGWMNDVDGAGNDQPIGRIVKLEDTDGDGRVDRSTVFMDGLVMPRAVQAARDGILVGAPPYLWFARDTNGDGRADEKIVLADDYMNFENPQVNPEADPNGPVWNLDNWLYNARYSARFRYRDGAWQREPAPIAGQWGLSQDDYGRHFFNTNQDQLRADALPAHYAARNPRILPLAGWNVRVAEDQRVWPIRVSPAANRGYRPGVLRQDGTLRVFEAACGPVIYRGDLFPSEFYGNAFVVDPVGHLIKRNIVADRQGILTAEPAYMGHEFLASTDERFRPVNLYTGPDGALYVVDMYRGIIEYIHVLTTYHRRQILERGLDRPLGLGRIYRVVPEGAGRLAAPRLSKLTAAELVDLLAHPNGWRRDTAQRLLVERGDRSVVPALESLVRTSRNTLARLHALWTLEGLNRLDVPVLTAALADPAARIRAAAVRLSEPWLRSSPDAPFSRLILQRAADPASEVVLQVVLSTGELPLRTREEAFLDLVLNTRGHPAADVHPYQANAILSGLAGRELEFLERLLPHPQFRVESAGAEALVAALSGAIFREGDLARVNRVLARVGDRYAEPTWVRLALIQGIDSLGRRQLTAPPDGMADWEQIADPDIRAAALSLAGRVSWPGKADGPAAAALTAGERRRFETGRREYTRCSACHLASGQGINGLAPALVDSDWVLGRPAPLVGILLHGKHENTGFPPMPAFADLDDEQIASIVTYIRREWGHSASPVDPELVARVRRETRDLHGPLTRQQLESVAAR
jgi:mono/diheme cytochrome c family protein/glucose/arabinose dehydrogenase